MKYFHTSHVSLSWLLSSSHSLSLSVPLLRHYFTSCKPLSLLLLIIIIIVIISTLLTSLLSRYNWSFIVISVIFIHQYHYYYNLMSLTRLPPTNLFKLISLNFIISVFVRAPKCFSWYIQVNRSFTCLFFFSYRLSEASSITVPYHDSYITMTNPCTVLLFCLLLCGAWVIVFCIFRD